MRFQKSAQNTQGGCAAARMPPSAGYRRRVRRYFRGTRTPLRGPEAEWGPVCKLPADALTGTHLYLLHVDFEQTNTIPAGMWQFLDAWKQGRLLAAGIKETEKMAELKQVDADRNRHNFIAMGPTYYIFKAVLLVNEDGDPDLGWISPSVSPLNVPRILRALDPERRAVWEGHNPPRQP